MPLMKCEERHCIPFHFTNQLNTIENYFEGQQSLLPAIPYAHTLASLIIQRQVVIAQYRILFVEVE
jgi:hypothetical protein